MQVKSHIRISFFILWHVREYRLARTAKGATGRMELKSVSYTHLVPETAQKGQRKFGDYLACKQGY